MSEQAFAGFPRESLDFFKRLKRNNDREWFAAHKSDFEQLVLEPARAFVVELGEMLRPIAPQIHAEPRVDRSIFRLHRDVRFSKDKRPFKTNLAVFLWEGEGSKLECPGFYLHLESNRLMIGGGIYAFSRPQLEAYRRVVDDEQTGKKLEKIYKLASKGFANPVHSESYKRVPRGYPEDHPRADLLMLKGMTVGEEMHVPSAVHSRRLLDFAFTRYEKMADLHKWLLSLTREELPAG